MKTQAKIAYSYIRFSTPMQRLGNSRRRQLEQAEQYCKEQNLALDTTLQMTDDGISAFKGDNILRGRLGEFLRLVDEKKVKPGSVLIVENIDRLTRLNVLDAQELFISIINRGVTIVTLTDKQVYSRELINENPFLLYTSLGSMMLANEESRKKSIRVSDAVRVRYAKARKGLKLKGHTPPWCEFRGGQFILRADRVEVVRRIFSDYKRGLGAMLIAKKLNAERTPTMGRTTKEWYKKGIRDLLIDKRLIGHAEHLNVKDYYPRVISDELFYATQASRQKRKRFKGRVSKNVGNLFSGLVRCGSCGASAGTNRNHRQNYSYHYLVCENARTGRGCKYKSFPYANIEASFLELINHDHVRSFVAGHQHQPADMKLETVLGQITAIESQIAKFERAFEDEPNPPKGLLQKLKELEIRHGALEVERERITNEQHLPTAITDDDLDVVNELRRKIDEEGVRLKIREYLRRAVDEIILFAPDRYVVKFKTGNVFTVFVERIKEPKQIARHTFQCCRGNCKVLNPSLSGMRLTSRPFARISK